MPHAPAREADMLDEIVALDDVLVQRGYDDGVRVGRARGEEEGAQLGRLKGAEVGVRFAVFRGRVEAFRALSSQHPSVFPKRAIVALEQAEQALDLAATNLTDPRSQAGFDALDAVENKLLAIASLLKLSQRPTEESQTLDF